MASFSVFNFRASVMSGVWARFSSVSGFGGMAAALPGQVFLDAPVAEVMSQAGLYFLLAHEAAHLVHQDHLAEAGREMSFKLLTQGVDIFDLEALGKMEPLMQIADQRARRQEIEADRFAGGVIAQLGYDPGSAAREVLGLLYSDPEAAKSLARSHGTLEERVEGSTSISRGTIIH